MLPQDEAGLNSLRLGMHMNAPQRHVLAYGNTVNGDASQFNGIVGVERLQVGTTAEVGNNTAMGRAGNKI
jgi:hypothetical protein